MSDTLFTLPGMVGDNIGKIPICYQYAKQYNTKVDICLDPPSLGVLNLLKREPWVEKAFISEGVTDYGQGGQPIDFGRDQEFRQLYKNVYHLGYRSYPMSNMTICSVNDTPIDTTNLVCEKALCVETSPPKKIVISAESNRHHSNINVIRTIYPIWDWMTQRFDVTFITTGKYDYYYSSFQDAKLFNDNREMGLTADLMSDAFVISTYSAMAVLAYILKRPVITLLSVHPGLPHFDRRISHYGDDTYCMENDSLTLQGHICKVFNISL
jgi:hypothetical protein